MNTETPKSPWNSLEIARLIASFMTPVLVVILGFQINVSGLLPPPIVQAVSA